MVVGRKEFTIHTDDYYPSLRLDITVCSPNPQSSKSVNLPNVLIDTGSDFTLIPNDIIRRLNLNLTGNVYELEPYDGKSKARKVKFYSARIIIDALLNEIIEVGGIDSDPLLGMDIISKWNLFINFPNRTFEISNPAIIEPPKT